MKIYPFLVCLVFSLFSTNLYADRQDLDMSDLTIEVPQYRNNLDDFHEVPLPENILALEQILNDPVIESQPLNDPVVKPQTGWASPFARLLTEFSLLGITAASIMDPNLALCAAGVSVISLAQNLYSGPNTHFPLILLKAASAVRLCLSFYNDADAT